MIRVASLLFVALVLVGCSCEPDQCRDKLLSSSARYGWSCEPGQTLSLEQGNLICRCPKGGAR